MKVADLQIEELRHLIAEVVEEKLRELLDPDRGLELREEVEARLRESLAAVERGDRGLPVEEVAEAAGLKWVERSR